MLFMSDMTMAPLHRRGKNKIEEPGDAVAGLPLGVTDALSYAQAEFEIGKGDTLALYTDGINEAIDAAGGFYTIDRLREIVIKQGPDPAKIGQSIVDDVRKFLGKAPQNDDMCLVCFGRVS
jgi:serine phosphatase RsbU (regulator of sigma subunit)